MSAGAPTAESHAPWGVIIMLAAAQFVMALDTTRRRPRPRMQRG